MQYPDLDDYIAVGAAHPDEPAQGTVMGVTHLGYSEPVLVFPGNLSPKEIKTLELSEVATCAVRLRDNLLGRPNRLSRAGGPLQAKEVTWVLCKKDGFFYRPVAAEIGGEPVSQDLLMEIWEHVEQS